MVELNGQVEEWLRLIADICAPLVEPGIKSAEELNPEGETSQKRLENLMEAIDLIFGSLDNPDMGKLYNMLYYYRGAFEKHAKMIGDVDNLDLQKRKEVFEKGSGLIGPIVDRLAVETGHARSKT